MSSANIDLLHQFCCGLCSDKKSKVICQQVLDMPVDVCTKILQDFSTRTLSQKIHPIREDDIYMASHKSYRAYMRKEKSVVGKAINEATINVLRRISAYLESFRGSTLAKLIEIHLDFPPSRLFLAELHIENANLKCCQTIIKNGHVSQPDQSK